jgi:glutamine amidotransferase
MSSARPTVLRYELDLFAGEGGERHRNRDGWGIAFAEDRDTHLFREAEPAASSDLAHMVLVREIPSRMIIAHVRRASHGGKVIANTHPFTRVRRGRVHHFAHNGTLHGIEALAESAELIEQRVGDTDSELAFLVLLSLLEQANSSDIDARFSIFTDFSSTMRDLGTANFLFYDGDVLYVHADRRIFETPEGLTEPREPGLVMRHFARETPVDREWQARGAHIASLHPETILFASVPLNEEGWMPVPRGATLALRSGRVIATHDF